MSRSACLQRLDRRLWILPLLSVATAAAVLIPTELILRARYPDQEIDRCIVIKTTVEGARANCASRVKVAEGPWVENRYNECGYRSPRSCGPVPAGSRRIAVIGSSMGAGFFVPEPESLTGRLPAMLTKACGRPVETQNLALPDFPITRLADSGEMALALAPNALLVTVSSYDLQKAAAPGAKAAKDTRPLARVAIDTLAAPFKTSTTVYMAKETYLTNEKSYSSFIAAQRRSDAELAGETSAGVAILADQIDRILKLDPARRVPIVLSFIPRREEIMRDRVWPGHRDPAAVALRRIADARGIAFVDGLAAVPRDVSTASLYYVANHHLNGYGDGYMAQAVAKRLIGSAPAFAGCRP